MHYGFDMELGSSDLAIDPLVLIKYKNELGKKVVTLQSYFLDDGKSIDAELIAKHLFPAMHCDVFISHSFNDQSAAIQLAHNLEKKGIVAFVDSMFWGSAYELLRAIDNKYSIPFGQKAYDYKRLNRSAAHVNMILASALQKMIMRSSMLLFLNTENSISTKHSVQDEKKTHSAWIHMELMFSHMIWQIEQDKNMLDAALESYSADSMPIYHKAHTEHLKSLTYRDFSAWVRGYSSSGNPQGFAAAAKNLYRSQSRVY